MEAGQGPGGGEVGDPAEVLSLARRRCRGRGDTARAVREPGGAKGLFLPTARRQARGLRSPCAGRGGGTPVSLSPAPAVSSLAA